VSLDKAKFSENVQHSAAKIQPHISPGSISPGKTKSLAEAADLLRQPFPDPIDHRGAYDDPEKDV
jgi:hypothetical protein